MARQSKVNQLPKVVRDWLDKALIEANFHHHDLLVEELERRGFALSRSGVKRYARTLKDRVAKIRDFNLTAEILTDAAQDKSGVREEALMALLQSELFDLLMQLKEVTDAKDEKERLKLLAHASRYVASLSRASIHQKKWAAEVEQVTLQRAAEAVNRSAIRKGLSAEAAAMLRADVLGVATHMTEAKPTRKSNA